MSTFGSVFELSILDGGNGFKLNGEDWDDQSGRWVGSAGDVNGDGFDDFLIGARWADSNGLDSGASYVVFGAAGGFAAELNLSTLNGINGFKIVGEAAADYAGWTVASAGDVNGDGFADVIIGATGADKNGTDSGAAYVVFGQSSGFAAELNLTALNGTNGFQINGDAANDSLGSGLIAKT